jgi:quercetin dioxygenase-like cupin family protein
MPLTRREVSLMLSALATSAALPSRAEAQTPRTKMLDSRLFPHAAVPYTGNETKKGRRFFQGDTHGGFNIEVHETILGAGVETHAPHQHVHEEVIVVVEGTVETYVDGRTQTLDAGSVIYFASNQMHSARNVGKTPSRYYVIELRGEDV